MRSLLPFLPSYPLSFPPPHRLTVTPSHRSTDLRVLPQGVVPALEYTFPCGLLDAADMTVQPECVEGTAGQDIVTLAYRVSEYAAIPAHTALASAIVGQIDAGWAGKEHVPSLWYS